VEGIDRRADDLSVRLQWGETDEPLDEAKTGHPTRSDTAGEVVNGRPSPPSTALGQLLGDMEEQLRLLDHASHRVRVRIASTTSALQALADVMGGLAAENQGLEAFKRATDEFADQTQRGLQKAVDELTDILDAAWRTTRHAIHAAQRDADDAGGPLSEGLAQLDAKLDGRFKDLNARLDDVEAVMADPLPVDVSGILHALESKLFVPLDEMADSLARNPGTDATRRLTDLTDRLERAAAAMETRPTGSVEPGDPDYQNRVLERLDGLAQQIESLRRRIALRSQSGRSRSDAGEPRSLSEQQAAPDQRTPGSPPGAASGQRTQEEPVTSDEMASERPEPARTPRKIRLR
jgi:hypothetical protein